MCLPGNFALTRIHITQIDWAEGLVWIAIVEHAFCVNGLNGIQNLN